MYALDDCDLHASFVPDLQLCLGIQHSHLASRETPSYTSGFMRSAISTLSLGYTPEKKNEWCDAVVLLTGMTTQAVRFHKMKRHIGNGLGFRGAYPRRTHDGRFQLCNRFLGMQYRWNKFSKAIRRGDNLYVYSIYSDFGYYNPTCMAQIQAREEVALISDKNKTKGEIFKRRTNRWNGPLGNSKRKSKEEKARKIIMSRCGTKEDLLEINNVDERMHGSWYGSVDTYRCEVASGNCLPRPGQMVRANRFLVPLLVRLQDVLQVQQTFASIYLAVESIQNEGCILPFFRALQAAHRAIAKCTQPVFSFSAVAFYLCIKQNKLQVDNKIKLHSDFNSVSTSRKDLCFDHFGISKEKIDPEPRLYVQPGCASITGALGATRVYPLQTRMEVLHSNATYAPYFEVSLFRRSIQHEGLRGFYMIALKIWAKGLTIKK